MIKRLRIKFICINMTIVAFMLLVILGMVLHFTEENLQKQSMGMIRNLEGSMEFPGFPADRFAPDEVRLPWLRVTWDREGNLLVMSDGYDERVEEETLREVIALAQESEEPFGLLLSHQLRFSKSHGLLGEQILFVDVSSGVATMKSLIRTCIFVGILSLGLFLVLSIFLARWAIRPVETAWNQQRQFVADASHELKTPLTVIMTNAELMQDPDYDEATRHGFAESILTMSRQMRILVESLLDLARLDSGSKMHVEPMDLSELVEESLLSFEALYFERELGLESELEENIRVRGSRTHLKQVLDILLDNGRKYTAAGGTVRVTLSRQSSSCLLSVAGPGETISREDLENIFRRFYRIDKARQRDGSYGLGLSIADSIVREHDGRIWAESREGQNTFFVQIPAL